MNVEDIQKIDEYIQGEITFDELSAYAQTHNLEDLEEKIAWVRRAGIAVEAQGVRDQIQQIMSRADEVSTAKQTGRVISMKPPKWIIGIAASALIVLAGYLVFFGENNYDNQFAAYEYVDPGLPVVMSQSDNYALYDALSYFGEENYKVSIEKLSAMQAEGADTDTISFYLGASLLYEDQPESAQRQLQNVLDTPSSKFTEKAEWLLVMCALKSDDVPGAKSHLNSIVNQTDHSFHGKAKELLGKLNRE